MNILPPLPLLETWRAQGLSPEQIYQKCEEFERLWKEKMQKETRGRKPLAVPCPLAKNELADLYAKHGLEEIGQMHGVSSAVVVRWLDEAGIETRRRGQRPGSTPRPVSPILGKQPLSRPVPEKARVGPESTLPPIPKEELAELYANFTLKEIGPMYGVSYETIRLWMKKLDLPRKKRRENQLVREAKKGMTREDLLNLYSQYSLREIARQFGTSYNTIIEWMDEAGITPAERRRVFRIRHSKAVTGQELPTKEELAELYSRYSLSEIAKQRRVAVTTVAKWMKGYGLETRPQGSRPWLKPIGCEKCRTEPFCKGLCRSCYNRKRSRKASK